MQINRHSVILIVLVVVTMAALGIFLNSSSRLYLRNMLKSKMLADFGSQPTINQLAVPSVSPPVRFSIGFLSDPHNNAVGVRSAIQIINQRSLDFTVGLGDYTDVGTTTEFRAIKVETDKLTSPFYSLPGDHDLWNGRDKSVDPKLYYHQEFGLTPPAFVHKDVQFLFLDNADLYNGIDQDTLSEFFNQLDATQVETIVILSHRAIYHPLTVHRMGYIQDEKNQTVLDQAEKIVAKLTTMTTKKIYMVHGDLHSSSSFKGPTDNIMNYSIGAVTKEKNFQTSRFAIGNFFSNGELTVEDQEIAQ